MDILKGEALVRSSYWWEGSFCVLRCVRGLVPPPPPPPGDLTDEYKISIRQACIFFLFLQRQSYFLLQKALETGNRLRVYWVTFKVQACPCSQPLLKCTLSVCLSGDPESVAGEYGRHSLYKMLGYFSLVGLLRLHSLLGDYYQAIKVLENIELNKKVIPCFLRPTFAGP